MSLLSICQDALKEIGGVEVPSSFYGNNNLTARQCLSLVKAGGNSLEISHRWTALISTYTFATVSGTASYALPSDFRAFAHMSQWDRTNSLPVFGPTSAQTWQFLKSGISEGATINRWFRIQGGYFYIHPTPTSADTVAFDYYSKNWITKQSDSSSVRDFYSDSDTTRLDEDLLRLDLKWRFLQAKGWPFEAEYKEFDAVLEDLKADDGGKGPICLGRSSFKYTNIPDTGFGS